MPEQVIRKTPTLEHSRNRITSDRIEIIIGLVAWVMTIVFALAYSELNRSASTHLATAILLFAPLVLVPLGLRIVVDTSQISRMQRDRSRADFLLRCVWRAVSWLRLPSVLCLAVALVLPAGSVSALFALPWFLVTCLLALAGILRLVQRRGGRVWQVSQDAALIMIAVGGLWTFLHCLGRWPMEFEPVIVLLTGVHFHYAGFVLPIVLGEVARRLPGPVMRTIVGNVVLSMPLLALGITFSPLRVTLLSVSSMSLLAGMFLATLYATGQFFGHEWIDLETMIPLHGVANAFGFSFCGLLGWRSVRA